MVGAATRENVVQWFDEMARRIGEGDRVIVYVAAHGGKASAVGGAVADPQDTEIYLWNSQRMGMTEFAAQLDKLSPQVPVIVVMVQCHAGGFANLIFDGGRAGKGLAAARRCGFFATLFDRPAAGCTPDVQTDNAVEYSSFFWAALGGKRRDGMAISPVDYDGDGATSLAEAHAFAAINAASVDIPLRTSEVLLRRLSPTASDAPIGPYSLDASYDELLALADPIERAVFVELFAQFQLNDGMPPMSQIRRLAASAVDDQSRLEARQQKAAAELQESAQRLRAALLARWPELANPWTPEVFQLVESKGDAIAAAIRSHGSFADFDRQHDEVSRLAAERLDLVRRYAKTQRLLRAIENIVLAANLPAVASSDALDQYRQLAALESQPLALKPSEL